MFTLRLAAVTLLAGTAAAQISQPLGPAIGLREAPVLGSADLGCTYLDRGVDLAMHARMTDASGQVFLVFMQPGWTGSFLPGAATFVSGGLLDPGGSGMIESTFLALSELPPNFMVEFYGLYVGDRGLLVTPPDKMILNPLPVETLDFDWSPTGDPLPAGIPIHETWAARGIHISADNAVAGHPDLAILFDSAAPTGDDPDLVTPGYGWMNDTAYGKLVIIAENDDGLDRLGYVVDPDDEEKGGTVFFRFDQEVVLNEVTLIDVDGYENVRLRCFRGAELMVDDTWIGVSDNDRMTLGFGAEPVTELQVRFSGSGGIAELKLTPCPVFVTFDLNTYGVPTGLQVGEVMFDQLEANLGFRISAQSFAPGTNKAAIFDTANPTGGDTDLVTPGYHPTNDKPLGKVMILAVNDIDLNLDGLIDDPGDDPNGGRLTFEFDYDVLFQSATVIDIDTYEVAFFEVYDAADALIGVVPLVSLGDNSVQTVTPVIHGARKIVLELSGSGALADLTFCRDFFLAQ